VVLTRLVAIGEIAPAAPGLLMLACHLEHGGHGSDRRGDDKGPRKKGDAL